VFKTFCFRFGTALCMNEQRIQAQEHYGGACQEAVPMSS